MLPISEQSLFFAKKTLRQIGNLSYQSFPLSTSKRTLRILKALAAVQ
jgi:hypothetical protein